MKVYGDVESVNLSTGERYRRVVGDGESRLESRLESMGIPGLQSADPTTAAEIKKVLDEMFEEARSTPKRGGLILPPTPGCLHDWQPFQLFLNQEPSSVFVSKCSKCHVLGMPPKKEG